MGIAAPGLTDVNGPAGDGLLACARALTKFKAYSSSDRYLGQLIGFFDMTNVLTAWIMRHGHLLSRGKHFAGVEASQIDEVARDIGVCPFELREFVREGRDAAGALKQLLDALDVDAAAIDGLEAPLFRQLTWCCVTCENKPRCRRELSCETAAQNFSDFCPNAETIEVTFRLHQERSTGALA